MIPHITNPTVGHMNSSISRQTRALWQLAVAAIVSAAVGAAGVLVWLGWHAILVSVMAGVALAVAVVRFVTWLQYRSGVYRCRFCQRPLRRPGAACDCPGVQAAREGR